MRDLVFKEGKIRPFTEFRAEALKIHQKYNQDWLLTEYNAVVRGSVMGKKWLNIERDKDIYPYLRYETAKDSRVRDAHAKLQGFVLPVESSFWENYFPPNGWNCRCSITQLRKDQVKPTDIANIQQNEAAFGKLAKQNTPEYWRKNIGKTEIFEANQTAYFKALPKDKLLDAEKHYNLPSIEKIYQKGNLPSLKTQNKADYQLWWDSLLRKYKGNEKENYFDIETDLGGIKLPIRFDNDFYKHIQKENRETWVNNLEDILNKPSEVWQNYEGVKNRQSIIFFKFYDKNPVILNVEKTREGYIAQTIFLDNRGKYEATKKRRKGFLIKKT
ncbi:phage minor head protein [Raineya orbicola]|uniref:Phage head morphogenesis protein, SPP1 gp7 family n=1 Tax=Raineya orbicola TaxID=2016530 RepID=A0A2N3I828_9BACT|nr:phage minor head protein [Raineya orbicola]PKQ66449.1 Phage head morphogenesis protein, SPP1 gp7 family [Raineya orbicola]